MLTEKATEDENKELRQRVSILHHKAEHNEKLLRAFFAAELELLSCTTLAELMDYLLHRFKQGFALSSVTLMLLDPEDALQELLDGSEQYDHFNGLTLLHHPATLHELFIDVKPYCGESNAFIKSYCFPQDEKVESCALLPLVRQNCLIGALCLGSADPQRYNHLLRYDYVAHLASVVAVCIENAISRETLQKLSSLDSLTRVLNRRAFNQQLLREIKRSSRTAESMACLLLDIDHFKPVNDTYGHLSGDKILREIAQLLKDNLRVSDCVARYGGEEFAILLPGCGETEAIRVSENLRCQIAQTRFTGHQGESIPITASLGVTLCEQPHTEAHDLKQLSESLIQSADQALYVGKRNGRNQVRFQALKIS